MTQTQGTRTLPEDWREAMSEMRHRQDQLVSEGKWRAGPSDFLKIIGRERDENTHSRMLGWLLDPTGRHGLGSALVRRLTEHCADRRQGVVRKVKVSEWRNNREADLVVRGDDFTLVIENKIDATEQPGQCDDLYGNWRNENAPLFLFLTPDGREPCTATTPNAQSAFRTLSWTQMREMIEAARDESRSATDAEDVVKNYLRTLKEMFG